MRKVWLPVLLSIALLMAPNPTSVSAQGTGLVTVSTRAEVTGAAAAVAINSSGNARWIQVIALTGNSAAIRCGDSNVSASRGLPIAAGGGFMFPPLPPDSRESTMQTRYNLANVYCYIGTGDKADFAWGN